jgi:hypothetical protein
MTIFTIGVLFVYIYVKMRKRDDDDDYYYDDYTHIHLQARENLSIRPRVSHDTRFDRAEGQVWLRIR